MEGLRVWSVGTDDGVVIASLPEFLRFPDGPLPPWMPRASTAIRDELRNLPIPDGTVLEATLAGEPPTGADLESVLVHDVGLPDAQVHAGVWLRRTPAAGSSIVQCYRRVPIAVGADEEAGELLGSVRIPLAGMVELETARHVWLAARRAVVAALPPPGAAFEGPIDLRVRAVTGPGRNWGSVDLIRKLLDGVCSAFHSYAGASQIEAARRLAVELRQDPEEMMALASSPHGALLGPWDYLALHGDRVHMAPDDERIHAARFTVAPGEPAELEFELRAMPEA